MALADYIENHHGLLHSDKDRPWCSNWPAIRKKSEVFGQLLVQPALNTNILGAEDGAVCTITALKLLLNWGVLESMNFFQKNIISSTTNIEHRQHHTREIDNINHWWCVWFRISAKILIMWWWIWTSVTLACVEERKCGTYVKFLQVSEPKSWPN